MASFFSPSIRLTQGLRLLSPCLNHRGRARRHQKSCNSCLEFHLRLLESVLSVGKKDDGYVLYINVDPSRCRGPSL